MKNDLPELQKIKTKSYTGYYLEDLKKWMSTTNFMKLQHWLAGQTIVIHQGKPIVFDWDLRKFIHDNLTQ